jgi:hypothetical protein
MTSAAAGRNADFGPEDYDAVEQAVMQTPRGRWFLSERDKRRQAGETQRILDALKKLESALAALPVTAPVPNGTDVLRALAAQRAAADPAPPKGVSTTELTSAPAESAAQALSMKNLKYFKLDEAVFTPAQPTVPKLAAVEPAGPADPPKPAASAKLEEPVAKGARLIVNHIAPASDATPAAAVPEPPPQPSGQVVASDETPPALPGAEPTNKRRIVIIRRAAAEPMEVPLQAEISAGPPP